MGRGSTNLVLAFYCICSICISVDLSECEQVLLQSNCRSVEFYDELSKVESSVDAGIKEGQGEADDPPQMTDFSIKALKLSGLTVELGNECAQDIKLNQSLNGMSVGVRNLRHMYIVCSTCSLNVLNIDSH